MMLARMTKNRKMFWRVMRRMLGANPGRTFLILLALGAGAAVTAALLNLQVDAKRRLATEFRALGANVVIAPRESAQFATLDESLLTRVPRTIDHARVAAVAFLYVISEVPREDNQGSIRAVAAGIAGDALEGVSPFQRLSPETPNATTNFAASPATIVPAAEERCIVGAKIAEQLHLQIGSTLSLRNSGRQVSCRVATIASFGGSEDSKIFLDLKSAQLLANLPGRVSAVQLSVPGTPAAIRNYVATLAASLPDADVHGVKQFTEAEAKIYNRIIDLLTAMVAVVLVLTGLCVMAAMTNVAMERKNDVGLMKAIGGATRRVLRLFLAEAALLGFFGGVIGAAVGIALSLGLGKAVFGVAAQPRLIVYPVSVALTMIVAIASSYPLRRLANIRPASVFRGEE
jgi:putative ABC transport system permease protein